MINIYASMGDCAVRIESDAKTHPEVTATLLRQVAMEASLMYSQMLKTAMEFGGIQVENDTNRDSE